MTNQKRCDECGKITLEVGFVSIAEHEYARLLHDADQLHSTPATQSISGPEFWYLSRSPIAKNPALAAYVLEAIKTKTYKEIIAETRGKFGLKNGLSKSSLSRFLRPIRLRNGGFRRA